VVHRFAPPADGKLRPGDGQRFLPGARLLEAFSRCGPRLRVGKKALMTMDKACQGRNFGLDAPAALCSWLLASQQIERDNSAVSTPSV